MFFLSTYTVLYSVSKTPDRYDLCDITSPIQNVY